jgi:hypothetical protein
MSVVNIAVLRNTELLGSILWRNKPEIAGRSQGFSSQMIDPSGSTFSMATARTLRDGIARSNALQRHGFVSTGNFQIGCKVSEQAQVECVHVCAASSLGTKEIVDN